MSTQVDSVPRKKKPKPLRRAELAQNDRIDSILLRLEAIRTQKNFGTFVLGVSGCARKSGVSTVAGNLAVRAAEMDLGEVLLIDANLNHPRQNSNFRLGNAGGLAELLTGTMEVDNALHNGRVDGLHVLPAGTRKGIKSSAATPDAVQNLMNELRSDFDLIIVDLPHDTESARTQFLATHLDGAILVIDAQRTRARDAEATLTSLRECQVDVLGTVLNRSRKTLPKWIERWF